jgi:hypothetical protein
MVTLTVAVGEAIIIDGHICIRILAIPGEEVYLEMNFPEFLGSDRNGAHGQQDEWKRHRNVRTETGEAAP